MDPSIDPFEIERPWGKFRQFTLNSASTVKIHTIKPDGKSSLQSHAHRGEFWHIIEGSGSVQIGEEEYPAEPGKEFMIEKGAKHRWTGGPEGMTLLEIAIGHFDEDDITRYEDKYGRA